MKILYISKKFSGIDNIIRGGREYNILPSFFEPLLLLIKKGVAIDFILVDEKQTKKSIQYINNHKIWCIPWKMDTLIGRIHAFVNLAKVSDSVIARGNYDFVYSHGTLGGIGNLIANKYKIPNGQRLYGVTWGQQDIDSHLKMLIRHPLMYLSFKVKKEFLLVTDDGSHSREMEEKFNKNHKKYQFYCWLNGVDKNVECSNSLMKLKKPFIFYPGRIVPDKRQDKALDIIDDLNDSFTLYFAGPSDEEYKKKLEQIIAEKNMERKVIILSEISHDAMYVMFQNAFAVLIFNDFSCKSNTTWEAMANGALLISERNKGLEDFIKNGENGYLLNDYREASKIINILTDNKKLYDILRNKVKETANLLFDTWEVRGNKEIELIENSIKINRKMKHEI